jgi:ABC-type nitrate/sulfonate/bicarbonate transport system substrate-binding protein
MIKHHFAVVLILAALAFGGCNKSSSSRPADSNKVRVGYIGLTCEAPIFTAVEKGFFQGGRTRGRTGEVQLGSL